jgi:hypothetical protein
LSDFIQCIAKYSSKKKFIAFECKIAKTKTLVGTLVVEGPSHCTSLASGFPG